MVRWSNASLPPNSISIDSVIFAVLLVVRRINQDRLELSALDWVKPLRASICRKSRKETRKVVEKRRWKKTKKNDSGLVFTARCYASAVLAMGLCLSPPVLLSVRLSVTSRSSTKTDKRRIIQTTPDDTPKDSSFLVPKISATFDRGHPLRGRRMQVGWVKIGYFWLITG